MERQIKKDSANVAMTKKRLRKFLVGTIQMILLAVILALKLTSSEKAKCS